MSFTPSYSKMGLIRQIANAYVIWRRFLPTVARCNVTANAMTINTTLTTMSSVKNRIVKVMLAQRKAIVASLHLQVNGEPFLAA
jgi:hypothetical protein